jgi:phage-related protein
MTVPVSALQEIAPSSIIELFELQLNVLQHGVSDTYYFHAGTNLNNNGDLIWNATTYLRFPIEADGFEYSGNGQLPRPRIRCSNIMGTITALILSLPYGLEGAKVSRIRTLARYLDAANFPARYNTLANTEALDAANWQRTGILAFGAGSVANATLAPDGSSTADLVVENTAGGAHSIGTAPITAGVTQVVSIHAKQGPAAQRYLQITVGGIIAASEVVTFDLTAGTYTTPATTTVYKGAGMTKLSNGWWRCWICTVPTNTNISRFRFDTTYGTDASNYVGNGTAGLYLWGAQIHEGVSTLTDYQAVGATWTGNPAGTPDPTAEFPREVFYIDRKVSETRDFVEYELAAAFDLAGVRAPKRQCISNICQWVYKSAECGYTGGLATCDKTLDACRAHFGATAELPYGSYPGVGTYFT